MAYIEFLVFVLPFLILRKLRMERLVRFGVYCTFGLGAINITFCLTRFLIVEITTDIDKKKVIPLTILGKSSKLLLYSTTESKVAHEKSGWFPSGVHLSASTIRGANT